MKRLNNKSSKFYHLLTAPTF